MLRLGVQVSLQAKLVNLILKARSLECNTFQFFSRNPRQWKRVKLDKKDVRLFKRHLNKEEFNPIVIHAPYTCNLASPEKRLFKNSLKAFIQDLQEANLLGADFFVFHIGSHRHTSEKEGLERVSFALKKVLEEVNTKTIILLENTSGSGSWLGYRFWHHRFILKKLHWTNKIGVCLDTCHLWSAGYNIQTQEGIKGLLSEIEEEVGLERVKLIHLNDSKDPLGSRRDRHQHIGAGYIGMKGFKIILQEPFFRNLPIILETPKTSDEDDLRNLQVVRRIYYGL